MKTRVPSSQVFSSANGPISGKVAVAQARHLTIITGILVGWRRHLKDSHSFLPKHASTGRDILHTASGRIESEPGTAATHDSEWTCVGHLERDATEPTKPFWPSFTDLSYRARALASNAILNHSLSP